MPGVLTRSFLEDVVRGSGWSLAEVESLSLEGEGISSLQGDRPFEGARRLVHLDLSRNHLSSLRGVEHLTSLASLVLRDNRVNSTDEVGRLACLPNLRDLDLRFNPVMSTETLFASRDHVVGGSWRSRSSGGGTSGGGSWGSTSSRSSQLRAGIVAVVPQLETLNGRRVLDDERLPHGSQQGWQEEDGEDEDEQPGSRQHARRQRLERRQVQQGEQRCQQPSDAQDRQQKYQHQHQHQHQHARSGEHQYQRRHSLRLDKPTFGPGTRHANTAGTRKSIVDEASKTSPRRHGSDDLQARDRDRGRISTGLRPGGAVVNGSQHCQKKPSVATPLPACFGNDYSGATVQHRVANAVHEGGKFSTRASRGEAASPTHRNSPWERTDCLRADGDHATLSRHGGIGEDDRFLQGGRDLRELDTDVDSDSAAPTWPSASELRAPIAVGGESHTRSRRGAEEAVSAVSTSRFHVSKGTTTASSTPRHEFGGSAPCGGSDRGSLEPRDRELEEPSAVAECSYLRTDGRRPKATPPPPPLTQNAHAAACSPSARGAAAAASSARMPGRPTKGSSDGEVIDRDDGAGDLAALWRELQGVDESLRRGGGGSGSSRRKPLTLSSLSFASNSSTSLTADADAGADADAATTSTARPATTNTKRVCTSESSGAARAVEAFRRSSQRLGLLPGSVSLACNGNGSGGGGGDDHNNLATRSGDDTLSDLGHGRLDPGEGIHLSEAESIPVPSEAGFGSTWRGDGNGSGRAGGSVGSGKYKRTGHGHHDATPVKARTSPSEALHAAVTVVELVSPSLEVATETGNAGSDSTATTTARISGPVLPGLAAPADAPPLLFSSKALSGIPPGGGTTTSKMAGKIGTLHAGGRRKGELSEEEGTACAEAWGGVQAAAAAGVTKSEDRRAEEERWRARERDFESRWAAREREFEERWAAREREIERGRREDCSQGLTAEVRSMLLGAHEALISSNAWLVGRLKTLEAARATEAAAAAAHAAHAARGSETRPESATAPAANLANIIAAKTNASGQNPSASSHTRPVAAGRSTVSRPLPHACRHPTDKIDGNLEGNTSLGCSERAACAGAARKDITSGASSPRSSPSSRLACSGVGVDVFATKGPSNDRAASPTTRRATVVAGSVRSRFQEGEGVDDLGHDVHEHPEPSAVASVVSDVKAAMAGHGELRRSRRGNIGRSLSYGTKDDGVKQVGLAGREVYPSVEPLARSNRRSDEGGAVAVAITTGASSCFVPQKKDSRQPVEGSRMSGVSPLTRTGVAAASSSPVQGAASIGPAAALPDGGSTPSIDVDQNLRGNACGVDGPATCSSGTVAASPRPNDGGGVFGIDPEITISAAPSH